MTGDEVEKLLDVLVRAQNRFHDLGMRRKAVLSQLPLNLTLLFVTVVLVIVDPSSLTAPGFLAAQAILLALLGLCAAVPWQRLPRCAVLAIPLLDFLPLALIRPSVGGVISGLGLLAVFPVIWLSGSGYRPRLTVALSALASLLMVWSPLLVLGAAEPHSLVSEIVVPFMLVAVAVSIAVLTMSGVAQQRRVEELLARSETRQRLLDTVLDTVDVGVLVLDREGKDVFMNTKQRQLYLASVPPSAADVDESELLLYRDGSEQLVPAEERPMNRALAGEQLTHEIFRLGRGPESRTVSISAREFNDATGERAGTVLACSDVTEVVAAVRARDSFLAAMSHEFRTPLTSLLGYAELLLDDPSLSPAALSDLQVMSRNARHLRKMVDDILAASVEGSTPELPRTRLDLARLMQQAAASAAPDAEAHGIALVVEADGALPILGDRSGVVRILDNLVSNALKYSDSGTKVTLAAERDGEWAVCSVIDEGFGIAPEDQRRVFTRFQRGDAALRSGVPGTGLGLALAQEVAELLGGHLEVTSQLGVGSVFTLRLPLAD
ncbi:sensor histidine kinase [Sinomonas terrae]|uniref:histidine kinase n=1 Tax=Sinomonas terrae TaxID=2908838 RepID=A0ABS9U6D6_9MICC|nr:ATP-binding protein [Sinomonas terrae]MCH6472263.1 PAS domain-containing sensor histidine kinase [Sinomonas terrae]